MSSTRPHQTRLRLAWLIAGVLLWLASSLEPLQAQNGEISLLRQQALDLVNQSRRQEGREPLVFSNSLNQAAQDHARDMLERGYYDHLSPEGEDVMDRYLARGGDRWMLVEENIASCSPCAGSPDSERLERLHQGWMESPDHRAAILRDGTTLFGFGIAAGETGPLYAVQTFAGTSRDADADSTPETLASGEAAGAFLEALNARRKEESLPPLTAAPALSELAANLLPPLADGDVELQPAGGLIGALPAEAQDGWRSLSVLSGECGGCGAVPDRADIGFFLNLWLDDPGFAGRLLGAQPTAIGFALRAYGNGRKVAVAVLGRR